MAFDVFAQGPAPSGDPSFWWPIIRDFPVWGAIFVALYLFRRLPQALINGVGRISEACVNVLESVRQVTAQNTRTLDEVKTLCDQFKLALDSIERHNESSYSKIEQMVRLAGECQQQIVASHRYIEMLIGSLHPHTDGTLQRTGETEAIAREWKTQGKLPEKR